MGGAAVNVFEAGSEADGYPLVQIAQHLRQRVGPRPAHRSEEWRQPRAAAGADQPEAAVCGWSEHQVAAPEQAEGAGDVSGSKFRNVAADEDGGTGRACCQPALHPSSEIATALSCRQRAAGPQTEAVAGPVGRYREAQLPTPVTTEAAQQAGEHRPLEAQSGGVADVVRQPPLADAVTRLAHEQHEMAPDQGLPTRKAARSAVAARRP